MKKPQPKKAVVITNYNNKEIAFYASSKAMNRIRNFGSIRGYTNGKKTLTVSERYDFNEVLEYMKNYG